jgi:GNAT superfamily N-acetyltransferase
MLPDWYEEAIAKQHDRKGFDCGVDALNLFLAKYARQAHESGASKTYVASDRNDSTTIHGFYTLSPAHIDCHIVPATARPSGGGNHPIGGFRLGRLATSKNLHRKGLGGELLISAARRCILASQQVGGTLLLIDAKDQQAANWYKAYGALPIPQAPLSLVLPYSTIIQAMQQAGKPIL